MDLEGSCEGNPPCQLSQSCREPMASCKERLCHVGWRFCTDVQTKLPVWWYLEKASSPGDNRFSQVLVGFRTRRINLHMTVWRYDRGMYRVTRTATSTLRRKRYENIHKSQKYADFFRLFSSAFFPRRSFKNYWWKMVHGPVSGYFDLQKYLTRYLVFCIV